MKYAMIVIALLLNIGPAYAEDAQQTAPAKYRVVLTEIKHHAGAETKIAPNDYPNGVFVKVKEMFGERPISAGIFADKMKANGFKIAESAEKADVIITIRSSEINFKEIDQNSDSMISGNKADAAAGIVITAVVTGGLSLLSSDYSGLANSKPVYQSMTIFIEPTAKGSESTTTVTTGAIKTDARNAKVTRAFFEIMADEWFKQHLRKDQPVVAAQPAETMGTMKQ